MNGLQTALITGGSHGLGRALATQLAERGVRVVIAARELAPLKAHAEALQRRGLHVFAVQADVADKEAIYPLVAQATLLAGPIDILINNASTLGPTPLRLLADTDCEDLELALGVNVVGAFRLTKALLGSMLLRKRGVVVNITSDASVQSYATWGAYGASKAALDQLTRIWAAELPENAGIRVFAVDPGEMDTRMHQAAVPDADRSALAAPEDAARHIVDMIASAEPAAHGARVEVATWRNRHASAA
ncbi:MAG TPA: SDR family oxidoreductase [Polyangiales bacterium]|nr:SDR family oxidoreductase [Polyangiales bacterium]